MDTVKVQIIDQYKNRVKLLFPSKKAVSTAVEAYQALLTAGENLNPSIQTIPFDKELLLVFRSTELAREWCLRFITN